MKTTIAVVILAVVMGILVINRDKIVNMVMTKGPSYVGELAEVQIVEAPKEDWMLDEEAIQAAKDVIKKKELTAELEAIDGEVKALQERRKEVARELDGYWTRENVKALIRRAFPEDFTTAVAVATCESGLKPSAHNPTNNDGTTDGGLWQINSVHDKRLQELGLDKYNPEDATEYARMLYDESGFTAWVCYSHNKIVMR